MDLETNSYHVYSGKNIIANTINLRLANDLKTTVMLIKMRFNGSQSGSNCALTETSGTLTTEVRLQLQTWGTAESGISIVAESK